MDYGFKGIAESYNFDSLPRSLTKWLFLKKPLKCTYIQHLMLLICNAF